MATFPYQVMIGKVTVYPGINRGCWQQYERFFSAQYQRQTGDRAGIPISIGIAPTKTWAKLANRMSPRQGSVLDWIGLELYRQPRCGC